MQRIDTHAPINHLARVHSEWPEETDDSVAKDSCREGRKNSGRRVNSRVIE